MRRFPSPLALSAIGLAFVLTVTAGIAWMVARQGANLGAVGLSILTSTYADDLLPRLTLAALFGWGGYLLTRPGSRPWLPTVAAACAIVGVGACLYLMVRYELAFADAFADGGVSGGWTPGAARAEFLPVPYLSALAQAVLGLLASTLLLVIGAFRRSRA